MRETMRNHWITGLALVAVVFLVGTGIAMMVSGGEFNETEVRIFGAIGSLAGLALAAGLWALRGGQVTPGLAYGLIVAGLLALGIMFWWFLLVPPVVAVTVLYAGVIRRGLARELRPG